jgi:central glycolytic genes regulator
MKKVDALSKLLPDFIDIMMQRYNVLKLVRMHEPIGRRLLADKMEITERVLRKEIDILKEQALLHTSSKGMVVTTVGQSVLASVEQIIKETTGLKGLELELKVKLNLKEIIIVNGDSEQDPLVKRELGRATVMMMMKKLQQKGNIITVTGGTTMAAVAEMMQPDAKGRQMLFIPARGGLGERHEFEANTICSKMATEAGADYRLLHMPEEVGMEALRLIAEEPKIKEVVALIKRATIVIHGIGNAKKMAIRRKSSKETVLKLEEANAVGEAFGYYFDSNGEIVEKINSIGLKLEELSEGKQIFTVAGGASKAKAILAYIRKAKCDVLITDEAAARELLSL